MNSKMKKELVKGVIACAIAGIGFFILEKNIRLFMGIIVLMYANNIGNIKFEDK